MFGTSHFGLARTALLALSIGACGGMASQPGAGNGAAELLDGTLDPLALPPQPVVLGPEGAQAYGVAEVPAGSRLQAAYALADAAARAELARLLLTRLQSLTLAVTTELETEARQACVERARAALPGLAAARHGARLSADGRRLVLAARIDLSPAEAAALLRPALPSAEPAAVDAAGARLVGASP